MRNKWMAGLLAGAMVIVSSESVWAARPNDGRVEFGEIPHSQSRGEFVDVNIGKGMIALTAKLIAKQDPEAASVLIGIDSVRLNVVGLDEENALPVRQKAQSLTTSMDQAGWIKIITAHQKGQDVSVHLKTNARNSVQGLTLVSIEDGREAVFLNVVGNIHPEQLTILGDRLQLETLEKAGKSVRSHK